MTAFRKVRRLFVGKPFAPLDPHTRHAIAVTPLLAWVGLGADGLSSSCYGPEEAFLALAHHTPLALFLAFATAATVFIIALGYNRVIALFPTGGGYRVATSLFVTSVCASRSIATTRIRARSSPRKTNCSRASRPKSTRRPRRASPIRPDRRPCCWSTSIAARACARCCGSTGCFPGASAT
ncbi:hypothetical protein WJ42_27845 [Burkholderia cepacia]|nr:hypothetical protein WJ42_27845 [Burkholderia cepacia]KWC58488.1 hypothetical protein WL55_35365 [Burkholderia cepacia]